MLDVRVVDKVSITIEREVLELVEEIGKKLGLGRSNVINMLLRMVLSEGWEECLLDYIKNKSDKEKK